MQKLGIIFFILFLIATPDSKVIAQQTPLYTLDMLSLYRHNTAFAGREDGLNFYGGFRSQFANIEENPNQYYLYGTIPMYILKGGIGFKLESYSSGIETINEFSLSYNRELETRFALLGLGGSLGLKQFRFDQDKIITPEGEYGSGLINHNDPNLGLGRIGSIVPIYQVSAFASTASIDAGFSASNFIPLTINPGGLTYQQSLDLTMFGIYYSRLPLGYWLESGVILRTNVNSLQTSIFTTVKRSNVFGGINVRGFSKNTLESIGFYGGIKFADRYTISYSYDVLVNTLRNGSEGSHEIMIKYHMQREVNTGLPPRTMYTPRNL